MAIVRQRIIQRLADNMNVNGSVTPVNYDFNPPEGGSYLLDGASIFLHDPGTTPPTNFGGISGLTNGVLFSVVSTGAASDMFVLKDNADISSLFSGISGSSTSVLGIGGGWLDSEDAVAFSMRFSDPLMLDSSFGDRFRVTIRDDLTAVQLFRIYYSIKRIK